MTPDEARTHDTQNNNYETFYTHSLLHLNNTMLGYSLFLRQDSLAVA